MDAQGSVVGFVAVWQQDAFIHHLYVSAGSRRSGVGTRLLASLTPWLPLPWHLKCVLANSSAMRFYQARGFDCIALHAEPRPPYALLRKGAASSKASNACSRMPK